MYELYRLLHIFVFLFGIQDIELYNDQQQKNGNVRNLLPALTVGEKKSFWNTLTQKIE
jgi:hypothetical protein